jgi:hypothetical protein
MKYVTILSLVLVLGCVGSYQDTLADTSQKIQEDLDALEKSGQNIIISPISIDSESGEIALQTVGTVAVSDGDISFTVDGETVSLSCNFAQPGDVIICTGLTCTEGQQVMITAPGNSVTVSC